MFRGKEGNFSESHRVTSQLAAWRRVSMTVCPTLWMHLCWLRVTQPCPLSLCSRLSLPPVWRHYLLGNELGQKGGGSGDPPPTGPIKRTRTGSWTPAQVLRLHSRTEGMKALSTQTQAACLLLLLLGSLSSSTYLPQQVSTPSPLWWESQVPVRQELLSTEHLERFQE